MCARVGGPSKQPARRWLQRGGFKSTVWTWDGVTAGAPPLTFLHLVHSVCHSAVIAAPAPPVHPPPPPHTPHCVRKIKENFYLGTPYKLMFNELKKMDNQIQTFITVSHFFFNTRVCRDTPPSSMWRPKHSCNGKSDFVQRHSFNKRSSES